MARADLEGLSRHLCRLLEESRAEVALCDVRSVEVDAVTVDALARLQLVAARHRCRISLLGASPQLRELVAFMGLSEVLRE